MICKRSRAEDFRADDRQQEALGGHKNSSQPDMDFSFRFGMQYKGFFLNAIFQGESGYKQNITDYYTLENNTLPKYQKYHLTDSWSESNPSGKYPRVKIAFSPFGTASASSVGASA